MKNRQYSLKVFETSVNDENDFITFLTTNKLLFIDHLILIKGTLSTNIQSFLESNGFKYLHNIELPDGRTRKSLENEIDMNAVASLALCNEEKEKLKEELITQQIINKESVTIHKELSEKLKTNFVVLDSMIRSGREINIDGDLLLLNRVNSGATIRTTGNLIITQVVEGAVRCDGHFMMITVSPKANIVFNGVVVDNELLTDKLNRIELKNREIFITPVIQKEINWAQS